MSARVTAAVATVVALAANAALTVVLILQPFRPASTAARTTETSVAVASSTFADERTVQLAVASGEQGALIAPRGGTVTAVHCDASAAVESGSSLLSIDGVGVLALHGSVPWWRDLPRGTRGEDATAVNQELARLGHDTASSGDTVTSATVTAIRSVMRDASISLDFDGVPASGFIWLPESSTPVEQCNATLGARIEAGAAVATLPAPIVSAKLAALPSSLVQGERTLTVSGYSFEIDANGALTALDRPELSDLASSASPDGSGVVLLDAQYALSTPIEVSAVPPQTIVTSDGVTGCVVGDDGPNEVTIVGSQLGQSYVEFVDAAPASVLLDPGIESCP